MSQCTAITEKRSWSPTPHQCPFAAVNGEFCGTHLRSRRIQREKAQKAHDTVSRKAVLKALEFDAIIPEGLNAGYWEVVREVFRRIQKAVFEL